MPPVAPGPVVDDRGLISPDLGQPLRDDAGPDIDSAPRRITDDDAHRPHRVVLRVSGSECCWGKREGKRNGCNFHRGLLHACNHYELRTGVKVVLEIPPMPPTAALSNLKGA